MELVWCIAETDDLYDPDHLFHETLGIKNYRRLESVGSAIQALAGGRFHADEIRHLPTGLSGFFYTRSIPTTPETPGRRYLSLSVDPEKSCIRMEDIFATFGRDYRLSPVPIRVPSPTLPGTSPSHEPQKLNPYGVSYQSARLFGGHPSGYVSFRFDYGECVLDINLQRNLDLTTYQQQQGKQK
ncbi:MAG: hypothetical protein WA159_24660 [Variovorax sp.]